MDYNKKYKIIYADPAWQYKQKSLSGAAQRHYPTMSTSEICKLPVLQIADENAVLFLWVTFPQLKSAFDVIKAWGFKYKTVAFVWIKQNRKSKGYFFGLGFWTREMQKYVYWQPEGNRNEYQLLYISLLLPLLRLIAKNLMK